MVIVFLRDFLKKTFMASFYGWGSTVSKLQSLCDIFIFQFPGVPGTQLINFRRMKGRVDLGATQWY